MQRESRLQRFLPHKRDAQIHCAPLVIAHPYPACHLLESAQATTAHVIAMHRRAMADTGRLGGDHGSGRRKARHGAIIPAASPAPAAITKPSPPRAKHRTSRPRAASRHRKQGAQAYRTPCNATPHPAAHTAPRQACHAAYRAGAR